MAFPPPTDVRLLTSGAGSALPVIVIEVIEVIAHNALFCSMNPWDPEVYDQVVCMRCQVGVLNLMAVPSQEPLCKVTLLVPAQTTEFCAVVTVLLDSLSKSHLSAAVPVGPISKRAEMNGRHADLPCVLLE